MVRYETPTLERSLTLDRPVVAFTSSRTCPSASMLHLALDFALVLRAELFDLRL
jgi:hypothetical protein